MLQLPALADLALEATSTGEPEAIVFADDVDAELFHVVPQLPRLRRTDGVPALRFVRYRDLAAGGGAQAGGFVEAGVELTLDDEQRAAITAALVQRYPGRTVRLAPPTYLDGNVRLVLAPVGGALVETVEGSSSPSMSGDMTASFSAELTELGARLLWDGLTGETSVLAVGYDVDVMARLPECTVRVWFDAVGARARVTHDGGDAGETAKDQLVQAGLAGVEVDDWPPDATLDALRQQVVDWGWALVAQAARVLGDAQAAGQVPDDRAAAAFALDLLQTRHTGVPWRIRPQGHLRGLTDAEVEHCRVSADLSTPVFDTREVQVLPNLDFDGQGIAAVDVSLTHGDQRLDVVLTGPADSAFFRYRVAAGESADYGYAHRVHLAHTAAVLELPGGTAHDAFHEVAVPPCGAVRLLVDAGAVDWTSVTEVTATLTYADASAGVPERSDALSLTATNPSQAYRRDVAALITQPVRVELRYALTDGRTHAVDRTADPGSRLLVTSPFEQVVEVEVAADGGFGATPVAQTSVVVEVELGRVRRSVSLVAGHERDRLRFDLLPEDAPAFRWRQTVSYVDGHSAAGDWTDGHGSSRLEVGETPGAYLVVEPATDLVDWKRVRLVRLTVAHPPVGATPDPSTPGRAAADPTTVDRTFTAAAPSGDPISIALTDPADDAYSAETTYFLTDGTRRSAGPVTTRERHLLLAPVP